jgi:hypothetical protein
MKRPMWPLTFTIAEARTCVNTVSVVSILMQVTVLIIDRRHLACGQSQQSFVGILSKLLSAVLLSMLAIILKIEPSLTRGLRLACGPGRQSEAWRNAYYIHVVEYVERVRSFND